MRTYAKDTEFTVKQFLAADISLLSRLPKVVRNGGWGKIVRLIARIFGAEEAI